MAISVDDALVELGGFGLFQRLILLGASMVGIVSTFQILLLSFIAAEPKWSCVNGSTICNLTGSFSVGDDDYNARCDMPRSAWYFHDDFTSIVTEFDLICEDAIFATVSSSAIFVGMLIGCIAFGYISDKFGRKKVYLYSIINISLVPLASAFADSFWLFTVCRVFIGTGIGASSATFVLLTEFTSVEHRGTMAMMFWFCWIVGYMLLALFAFLVRDWIHLTILTSALGLPGFIVWWFFPESVRWYLIKGRSMEAEKVLRRVASYNKKPMIKENLFTLEEEQTSSFRHLFATSEMRKYTLLSCFIWGVNAAVFYGVLFSSVTLGGNMYLNFFTGAVVEIPANFICLALINRIGRKPCVMIGMVIASVTSVAAVVCQIFEKEDKVTDGFWMARVFASLTAKLAITVSFNCVWAWSNELFPTVVRNIGMGTANSIARIGSFSSGYIIWLVNTPLVYVSDNIMTVCRAYFMLMSGSGRGIIAENLSALSLHSCLSPQTFSYPPFQGFSTVTGAGVGLVSKDATLICCLAFCAYLAGMFLKTTKNCWLCVVTCTTCN